MRRLRSAPQHALQRCNLAGCSEPLDLSLLPLSSRSAMPCSGAAAAGAVAVAMPDAAWRGRVAKWHVDAVHNTARALPASCPLRRQGRWTVLCAMGVPGSNLCTSARVSRRVSCVLMGSVTFRPGRPGEGCQGALHGTEGGCKVTPSPRHSHCQLALPTQRQTCAAQRNGGRVQTAVNSKPLHAPGIALRPPSRRIRSPLTASPPAARGKACQSRAHSGHGAAAGQCRQLGSSGGCHQWQVWQCQP